MRKLEEEYSDLASFFEKYSAKVDRFEKLLKSIVEAVPSSKTEVDK